jgi:hypothetical protein
MAKKLSKNSAFMRHRRSLSLNWNSVIEYEQTRSDLSNTTECCHDLLLTLKRARGSEREARCSN